MTSTRRLPVADLNRANRSASWGPSIAPARDTDLKCWTKAGSLKRRRVFHLHSRHGGSAQEILVGCISEVPVSRDIA